MNSMNIPGVTLLVGDARERLADLPDQSAHCCVTSPPYFGLRDYGTEGQMGLEATPDTYVSGMVALFREVRRVLRDDGTLWLNLGDSYSRAVAKGGSGPNGKHDFIPDYGSARRALASNAKIGSSDGAVGRGDRPGTRAAAGGLADKQLLGIPWRVAFALQADGWYLRQDIIWHKPNPMPESVRDRCTKAHEYIFLLSKGPRYYFDADAVKEDAVCTRLPGRGMTDTRKTYGPQNGGNSGLLGLRNRLNDQGETDPKRNRRSVWTVTTKPYAEAHFATYPPDLIEPCILAGCPKGGTVLDPFGGSGTTAGVALKHGRKAILVELNPVYANLVPSRINSIVGGGLDLL